MNCVSCAFRLIAQYCPQVRNSNSLGGFLRLLTGLSALLGVDLDLKVNGKPLDLCAYSDHVLLIKWLFLWSFASVRKDANDMKSRGYVIFS